MSLDLSMGVGRKKLSRRALLTGAAAGSAGLAIAAACGGDDDKDGVSAATGTPGALQPVIGPVEQQKQLRIRTGLTAWDPSKTFDGYTVFAPNRGQIAVVIDMDGNVVKTWDITTEDDQASVWNASALDNGNLFIMVTRASQDAPPFVFKGGTIMELDWDGNEVWRFDDPDQHHDAKLLPNGNLLLLRTERLPDAFASSVPGGLPGTEGEHGMWADWAVETTLDGEVVWEWHAQDHLDPNEYPIALPNARDEWTHGNSVDQLPNGDLLISFRNIDTVAIVDRASGNVRWELRAPAIAQQHNAQVLENGNVLIFDNGAHRANGSVPYSRILEIDVENPEEPVWVYQDPFLMNFFSPFISGAQRLANGNTLIAEGNFGRIFEVTAESELVWEYINPFIATDAVLGANNAVYRAYRYPASQFPNA
jgi:hypothetical protein